MRIRPIGSVTRLSNVRFGINMGNDPKSSSQSIGWTVLALDRPQYDTIEFGPTDDSLDRLLVAKETGKGEIEIACYMNDDVYAGSRGHTTGLSREAHTLLVAQTAARLAEQGHRVVILEISR